jgi:N-glycosylase/DNA lyase
MLNKGNKFKIELKVPFSLDKTLKSEQCPADLWFFDYSQNYWVSYIPVERYWVKVMLRQNQNIIEGEYLPKEYEIREKLLEKLDYIFQFENSNEEMLSTFSQKDDFLAKVVKYCRGIRIMRDLNKEYRILEAVITQNTSVKMIKVMQRLLFLNFGDEIQIGDEKIFTYPKIEKIAKENVIELKKKCKLGYRAQYVKDIAQQILSGNLNPQKLEKMPTEEAKKYLMGFRGIGKKVSDLILMYGFGRRDVFPLDIWIKKAIKREYFKNQEISEKEIYRWAREYFNEYASLFNLMIFLYERKGGERYYNYCVWR